ncbi:MAG: LicD family protein [Lachnospiraceae bacterium]|nr:LicD family protein [Lachnospiraceae bacterium]
MHFDESFFEGEERDGFYISPMVKRAWAVELDILEVISRICRKYQIRWFAEFGTMIGAVRHNGYIPWDDDIDISMLRPDYEKFMRYARKELPKGYRLVNGRQDKNPSEAILQVQNTSNINTSPAFLKNNHGCPYIIGVDIFVIDKIPDDPEEEASFRELATISYHAFKGAEIGQLADDCEELVRDEIYQLADVCSYDFDYSVPIKPQLLDLADHISAMYYDVETSRMTVVPYYCVNPAIVFPVETYSKIVRFDFEVTNLPVPQGYDEVLSIWYGDYMTPRNTSASHEYPYFIRDERTLRKQYEQQGQEFPEEFTIFPEGTKQE